MVRKFQGCWKKVFSVEVSGVCWEHFKGVSKKFRGCFRSVFKRVSSKFQRSLEAVLSEFPGVSRKFPGVSWNFQECVKEVIEVYGNHEGVSKNLQTVSGKYHREISMVFQVCFTGDSSLLSKFQGKFQESFKDIS